MKTAANTFVKLIEYSKNWTQIEIVSNPKNEKSLGSTEGNCPHKRQVFQHKMIRNKTQKAKQGCSYQWNTNNMYDFVPIYKINQVTQYHSDNFRN